MRCPECSLDNPTDSKFCKECGTSLSIREDAGISHTKTYETSQEELSTGSIFAGRYQIVEELGRGGMGRIYKAVDNEVGEKIALKLIKPEISADKDTIERFRNELKFARKVRHKNVCQMFDLNRERDTYFITMEYVAGEDLKNMIRMTKRLGVSTALDIALQICEGLAEAHKQDVIHRDLKPTNIMLDREGNVRIMDFGIARSLKGKGRTGVGVIFGTPEYMSPEQVEAKQVDQQSDIYSLGVILYEMVTGRLPFEADTPFAVGVKHKSEIPQAPRELNSNIPDDLNQLILKCLEKEKDSRYQSADELSAELKRITQGLPVSEKQALPKKPLTPREFTVSLSPKKIWVPALIFIGIMIAGFVMWRLLFHEPVIPFEERRSVAVIGFDNHTGESRFDYLSQAVPSLLISKLEQSQQLRVITWERMQDILEQMGYMDVTTIDRELGFELCQKEGIEAIVIGSVIKTGNMFATDIKVLDVSTKEILTSAQVQGEGEDSILKNHIDDLSEEITRGMGIRARLLPVKQPQISDLTTDSLQAYNYFLKGRVAFDKFYYDEARIFLEKAVEADPEFAVAHFYLSRAYGSLGSRDLQDESLRKAKAFSVNATEKERLYIDAFFSSSSGGNVQEQWPILEELLVKYPEEKWAHYELGVGYSGSDYYEHAIEHLQSALELDPDFGSALNQLAYVYSDRGEFKQAIDFFKKYAEVSPGDANPIDSIAELYFRMGDLDQAIATYREALQIKVDFGSELKIAYIYALGEEYREAGTWLDRYIALSSAPGLRAEGFLWKAFYAAWLGQTELAFQHLRRADELAEGAGNPMRTATINSLRGLIHLDRQEFDTGREYIQKFFDWFHKVYPDFTRVKIRYPWVFGIFAAQQGNLEDARAMLLELKTMLEGDLTPAIRKTGTIDIICLETEVLLAEGHTQKAVELCEKLQPRAVPGLHTDAIQPYNSPFSQDILARAYRANGDFEEAIVEYEKLVTFDPQQRDRLLINPKYYYRLARLYQQTGQTEKAIAKYERFLDLYKDADPDFSEVEDAKKQLSSLK